MSDLKRCKWGYDLLGYDDRTWGKWSTLTDGHFDQCRRDEHGEGPGSWHFPDSGGAVSKFGKRIDDPAKWEPMWTSIQASQASDEYSLNRHLWPAIEASGDRELLRWADTYWLTPGMARALLYLDTGNYLWTSHRQYLRQRKLVDNITLSPVGQTIVEILKGWDRA